MCIPILRNVTLCVRKRLKEIPKEIISYSNNSNRILQIKKKKKISTFLSPRKSSKRDKRD